VRCRTTLDLEFEIGEHCSPISRYLKANKMFALYIKIDVTRLRDSELTCGVSSLYDVRVHCRCRNWREHWCRCMTVPLLWCVVMTLLKYIATACSSPTAGSVSRTKITVQLLSDKALWRHKQHVSYNTVCNKSFCYVYVSIRGEYGIQICDIRLYEFCPNNGVGFLVSTALAAAWILFRAACDIAEFCEWVVTSVSE
jgi:hypothetical protein